MKRGFCGIGIVYGKNPLSIGTLWRSAQAFGADFIYTVGRRYPLQASDTTKAWKHIPLLHFETVQDLVRHLPYSCRLIGVEIHEKAIELGAFCHPERACYLLGAEDIGLSKEAVEKCHQLLRIPGASRCLNVAVAGSIVLYDRIRGEFP